MIPPPYMVNLQWPISARLTCYNPTSRESSLTPNYTGGCIYRCVYMYTLWHTHTYIYILIHIFIILTCIQLVGPHCFRFLSLQKFQFEALAVQIIIVVVHALATCDSCAAHTQGTFATVYVIDTTGERQLRSCLNMGDASFFCYLIYCKVL